MYLWCDGAHDPEKNMLRDAALLAAAARAPGFVPVLRLFRFFPHGITLGYAQRPERELDLDRCRRDGVPWAVRPTGGRAIFHAEEWTYALAARIDDPDWGGSLDQAYDAISSLLLRSLIRLGVPARRAPAAGRRLSARSSGVAPPCFASTTRHEVVIEGRKLVGSAQRRAARALLQQGSVLLGPGHLRLVDYLAIDDREREPARRALAAGATHAGPYVGAHPPLEAWAASVREELPGVRRVDGAAGLFLLTPPESGSYTAALR